MLRLIRPTLITLVCLLCSMCISTGGKHSPANPMAGSRPNIIYIFADDLSFRDLSVYGQQQFTTPTLNALAVNGLRFSQGYAAAPECAPSRGTMMTGLHTGHAPIRTNSSARGQDHLNPEDITIAEVLKEAGYATGMVGKWGMGLPGTPGTPDRQGFDFSFGYWDQSRAHTFFPHYLYKNDEQIWYPENFGFDMERLYSNNINPPNPEWLNQYDDQGKLIAGGVKDPDKAIFSQTLFEEASFEFIRDNKDQPFFLYCATQLPHGPPVIDDLGEIHKRDDYPTTKHKEWAAMVQRIDTWTSEMIALLKQLNIYENTLIVFSSDNGYSMCGYFGRGNANNNWPDDPFLRNKGPFRGGKFSALEGGTRIPFFVSWPGAIEPGTASTPVWLVDLFPTFAELAGATVAHNIDGASLLPLMAGQPEQFPNDRPLYWEKQREQAVRMGPWKAYRKTPDSPMELYLIEEDIHGDRNLASLYPGKVAQMKQIMLDERVDHEWYWNPQETREEFAQKQQRAIELGQQQVNTRGNTVYPEGYKQ